jgi:hypothetical protein
MNRNLPNPAVWLEADRQCSAAAGFNAHLLKPVDLGALGKLLAHAAHVTP